MKVVEQYFAVHVYSAIVNGLNSGASIASLSSVSELV